MLCCRQINHLSWGHTERRTCVAGRPTDIVRVRTRWHSLASSTQPTGAAASQVQDGLLATSMAPRHLLTHTRHLHASATLKVLKAFTQRSFVNTLADHQPAAECRPHCRPDCSILVCPCTLNFVQAWIKQHHGCQAGSSTVALATAAECQQQQARHNSGQGYGSATTCLPVLRILSLCANSLDAVSITGLTQGN